VYCVHAIVHNRSVVDRFERLGVIFVDDIDDVPRGAPVVLSAHGSAPDVVAAAGATRHVVDAVCPLVRKVHHEIRTRAAAGRSCCTSAIRATTKRSRLSPSRQHRRH
jgi:4-hydroxy-3-methylbut-2-enyl diphosphate reductase